MIKAGQHCCSDERLTIRQALFRRGYGFIMNDEMDDFDAEVGTANNATGQETDEFLIYHHSERQQPVMTMSPRLSEEYLGVAPGYLNVIGLCLGHFRTPSQRRESMSSDW